MFNVWRSLAANAQCNDCTYCSKFFAAVLNIKQIPFLFYTSFVEAFLEGRENLSGLNVGES